MSGGTEHKMERVNRILQDEEYREFIRKNEQAEADRRFCCHNMSHFLDVARIALLLNLREEYGQEQEMIYAAALLHDVGRWKQYEDGTPHQQAGVLLAPDILKRCGFEPEKRERIVKAIGDHRNEQVREERTLSGLLYRADKLSRPCFACREEKACNWKEGKKNSELLW